MSGIEDAIVYVGAVVTAFVVSRLTAPRVEAPQEKRCSSTMDTKSSYGHTIKERCVGASDPRCAGNQCTSHCRDHCKGKCLE